MKEEIYLSIVIPAYKEEKRIHIILEAISKYVRTKDFIVETIVVVDGSPDDTAKIAQSFTDKIPNFRVIGNEVNQGKGGAVRDGMIAAKGDHILFADADNSTPIEQVDKLLEFTESYDVVIGSRYTPSGKIAIPQTFTRRAGSRAINAVIQMLAVSGIADTQCGFKLFSAKAAKEIFPRLTILRFSFDIEVLAIARNLGYKIKEVGITWYDNPHSTVNPIRDGLRMIRDAWQVRRNIMAGQYRQK